jgi:hypothetical protein
MKILAGIATGMIALAVSSLVALFIYFEITIADWIMGE